MKTGIVMGKACGLSVENGGAWEALSKEREFGLSLESEGVRGVNGRYGSKGYYGLLRWSVSGSTLVGSMAELKTMIGWMTSDAAQTWKVDVGLASYKGSGWVSRLSVEGRVGSLVRVEIEVRGTGKLEGI